MKEYKCWEVRMNGKDTESDLNDFAKEGWKVICSYALSGHWLIMEREKSKPCKVCGK